MGNVPDPNGPPVEATVSTVVVAVEIANVPVFDPTCAKPERHRSPATQPGPGLTVDPSVKLRVVELTFVNVTFWLLGP